MINGSIKNRLFPILIHRCIIVSAMVKVSQRKLTEKDMDILIGQFWDAISSLNNQDEARELVEDLLTHTEIKMFAKRIQIAKMLIEKNSYKDITQKVKVTSGTISQVNNILNTRGVGLRRIVKTLT